MSCCKANTTCV